MILSLLLWVIHKLFDAAAKLKSTGSLESDTVVVVMGHTQTDAVAKLKSTGSLESDVVLGHTQTV